MDFRFAEEQPQDDYAAELAGFFFFFFMLVLLASGSLWSIGSLNMCLVSYIVVTALCWCTCSLQNDGLFHLSLTYGDFPDNFVPAF